MINTGMNRIGVKAQDAVEIIPNLLLSKVELTNLCTHMADSPGEYTTRQLEVFSSVINELQEKDIKIPGWHVENSLTMLNHVIPKYPGKRSLRVGQVLYGWQGTESVYGACNLKNAFKPVSTFRAKIRHVHALSAGETIGYGCSWACPEDTIIATVGVGYADGYPHGLSNTGYVSIEGTHYRNVGTVCMDMFMINLGPANAHGVQAGNWVTLWGFEDNHPKLNELMELFGGYFVETMVSIGNRVKRVYVE